MSYHHVDFHESKDREKNMKIKNKKLRWVHLNGCIACTVINNNSKTKTDEFEVI